MANIFFPRGKIFYPEQVLEPRVAVGLGSRILELATEYKRKTVQFGPNITLNIDDQQVETTVLLDRRNCVSLDEHDRALVTYCKDVFSSKLPKLLKVENCVDFFIGAAAGGNWHIDITRDVRALINLSSFPAGLQVATCRSPNYTDEAVSKYKKYVHLSLAIPLEPDTSKTIMYGPGEAVGINNLAREDRQVPHKAIAAPGRVVMRLFATAD